MREVGLRERKSKAMRRFVAWTAGVKLLLAGCPGMTSLEQSDQIAITASWDGGQLGMWSPARRWHLLGHALATHWPLTGHSLATCELDYPMLGW